MKCRCNNNYTTFFYTLTGGNRTRNRKRIQNANFMCGDLQLFSTAVNNTRLTEPSL